MYDPVTSLVVVGYIGPECLWRIRRVKSDKPSLGTLAGPADDFTLCNFDERSVFSLPFCVSRVFRTFQRKFEDALCVVCVCVSVSHDDVEMSPFSV